MIVRPCSSLLILDMAYFLFEFPSGHPSDNNQNSAKLEGNVFFRFNI